MSSVTEDDDHGAEDCEDCEDCVRWRTGGFPVGTCRDCGAPWVPVRRGECNECGSDAGPVEEFS